MASKVFMLSYTVSHKEKETKYEEEQSTIWANDVRRKILNLQCGWKKHAEAETTFTGTMNIDGYGSKVAEAKKNVAEQILPILEAVPSKYKPLITFVLLVDGVGEVVKFAL